MFLKQAYCDQEFYYKVFLPTIRSFNDQIYNNITLIAASKGQSVEAIIEAYTCLSIRHFGENYVHELLSKSQDSRILAMCPDINWHFIGHLQSNKVRNLIDCPRLWCVETVDSHKLADLLEAKSIGSSKLRIMIQVNSSQEKSKHGVINSEKAISLARYVKESCSHLILIGLMTVESSDRPDKDFQFMKDLFQKVKDLGLFSNNIPYYHLSMGMSKDWKLALKYGATDIRLGSSLFTNPRRTNDSNHDMMQTAD